MVPQHREADRFLEILGVFHRGLVAQAQSSVGVSRSTVRLRALDGMLMKMPEGLGSNAMVSITSVSPSHLPVECPSSEGLTLAG